MNGKSDRDIETWDQRLLQQTEKGWDNYLRRRIHLDTARTMEYWPTCGELFYVESTSSESASATIRIGKKINDPISLRRGVRLRTVFRELYLTNTAQPGEWIDVIIGINFDYEKPVASKEMHPTVVVTNVLANQNTIAAAHPCNDVLLRASPDNTGRIWVDFTTPVLAVNTCYPLDRGEIIAGELSNTDQINAWFTVANELLFVVYQ